MENRRWYWLGAWLVIGILLRGYNLGAYPFGFDQVQILTEAEAIRGGDLTLIGPRTGPAAMFTGPLIYYLNALVGGVTGELNSIGITAMMLAGITGLSLYCLGRRYLGDKIAGWLIVVWAVSPFLISQDRVLWNPNLMVLASSLVLFPLLLVKKWQLREVLIISVGLFLAYEAHFAGFLLVPLAMVGMYLSWRRERWPGWWMMLPILAFGLSLLPTLMFDLRNDWLNWRGFIGLITNREQVSWYLFMGRLGQKLFVIAESMGKIWWYQNQTLWVTVAGIVGLGAGLKIIDDKSRRQARSLLGWLIFLVVALAFYRESTPEYYFLAAMPVWLVLWSFVLVKLPGKFELWVQAGAAVYTALLVFGMNAPGRVDALVLSNTKTTAVQIKSLADNYPVAEIRWDMEPVETIGLEYLLNKQGLNLMGSGMILHVIYPLKPTDYFTHKITPMIGLWLDNSQNMASMAVPIYPFIVYVPSNLIVLEEFNIDRGVDRSWRVENEEGETVAGLELVAKMTQEQKQVWDEYKWQADNVMGWQKALVNNQTKYGRRFNKARLEIIPVGELPQIRVVEPGSLEGIPL